MTAKKIEKIKKNLVSATTYLKDYYLFNEGAAKAPSNNKKTFEEDLKMNYWNCNSDYLPKNIFYTLLHHGGKDKWEKMLVLDDNYYFRNRETGKTLCVCSTAIRADYNITDYTVLVRHPDEITDNGAKAGIRGKYLLNGCWNCWHYKDGVNPDYDEAYYIRRDDLRSYQILDHKPVDWELWKYAPKYGTKDLWYYDPDKCKWTMRVLFSSDGECIKL